MAKALYQLEGKLSGELLDTLSAEASTSSIRCRFFESDEKATQRTPDSATVLFCIDPENTQGKKSEWILATSHSTSSGITTLSTVTRGLQRDATIDLTGSATRAQAWDAGTPIGVVTIPYNANLMKAYFEGTESVPGNMQFGGDVDFDGIVDFDKAMNPPIYADATARDAAIPSPREGSIIKNTAQGANQQYIGGTWVDIGNSSTPNASETVTGKVQLNTTAQTTAATDTDGGDPTVNKPSETARVIQNNSYIYGSSSAGTDTYVVTLTPAITAYASGQAFILNADVTNTGACTVNYNSLGAKSIKLPDGSDPSDGDIIVGPNVLIYDGTNFVLSSATANVPATTTYVDDNTNIKIGSGSFSPASTSDTSVIAHGLGRTPKLVRLTFGHSSSVNTYIGGFGTVLWTSGDGQKAIVRYSPSAGNVNFTTSFLVDDTNGSGQDWIGTLTADSTNITIGVSSYTDTCSISYTWEAL